MNVSTTAGAQGPGQQGEQNAPSAGETTGTTDGVADAEDPLPDPEPDTDGGTTEAEPGEKSETDAGADIPEIKRLPEAAQRKLAQRFGKLTARYRQAESGLQEVTQERDRLKGELADAGKALDPGVIEAARKMGVSAGLITQEQAQQMQVADDAQRRSEAFTDWLDEHPGSDETMPVTEGGQPRELSRQDVVLARRYWSRRAAELAATAAPVRASLEQRAAKIWRLGLEAERNRGMARRPAPVETVAGRATSPAAAAAAPRTGVRAPSGAKTPPDFSKVDTTEALAEAIERM